MPKKQEYLSMLKQIAVRLNQCCHLAGNHQAKALQYAKQCGDLLLKAKELIKHGEFVRWRNANFEGSKKTAEVYQKISLNWNLIKPEIKHGVSISIDAAIKIINAIDSNPSVVNADESNPLSSKYPRTLHQDLEKHEVEDINFYLTNNLPSSEIERINLASVIGDWEENVSELKQMLPPIPRGGNVKSHFLDSGAYSIYKNINEGKLPTDYYQSDEFFKYVDDYARFVKDNQAAIDQYANVDAIRQPKITYDTQMILEHRHGLCPVPVIHFPADLKWLKQYMNDGHKLIGVGGMADANPQEYEQWLSDIFEIAGDKVQFHGFAMFGPSMLWKFPWASVDATTWAKVSGGGKLLVPKMKSDGDFDFNNPPDQVKLTNKTWRATSQQSGWINYLSTKLSHEYNRDKFGEALQKDYAYRKQANLIYFNQLESALRRSGRDIILYYSGQGDFTSNPEVVLGKDAHVMLSYWEISKGLPALKRFHSIRNARASHE